MRALVPPSLAPRFRAIDHEGRTRQRSELDLYPLRCLASLFLVERLEQNKTHELHNSVFRTHVAHISVRGQVSVSFRACVEFRLVRKRLSSCWRMSDSDQDMSGERTAVQTCFGMLALRSARWHSAQAFASRSKLIAMRRLTACYAAPSRDEFAPQSLEILMQSPGLAFGPCHHVCRIWFNTDMGTHAADDIIALSSCEFMQRVACSRTCSGSILVAGISVAWPSSCGRIDTSKWHRGALIRLARTPTATWIGKHRPWRMECGQVVLVTLHLLWAVFAHPCGSAFGRQTRRRIAGAELAIAQTTQWPRDQVNA